MINDFEQLTIKHFKFLEGRFNCKYWTKRDNYGDNVIYQNSTTGIKIRFEPRENHIFVMLMRLIEGKLPDYPIFIKADTQINLFYLDDLLELRSPSLKIKQKDLGDWINSIDLENLLAQYAKSLQQFGIDILQGDFTVFNELEQIVKRRVENLNK